MYGRLANLVTRHWLIVILFWIGLAVGLNAIAPVWDDVTNDGDLAYMPAEMTSVRGEQLLARAFPNAKSKSQVALVIERPDGPLQPADYKVANRLAEKFKAGTEPRLPIADVWTADSDIVGEKLISPVSPDTGQATIVVLLLTNEFMATHNILVLEAVNQVLAEARQSADFPSGLRLGVSGSAAIGGDMLTSAKESIDNTEVTATILVVVFLLLVYRAPLLVVIPLTAIVISVLVSMDVVALLAYYSGRVSWLNFKVFKTTKIFIIVLLFGSGTDFCLFLIARYREELKRGLDRAAAIWRTVSQTGDALVASALTTVAGLLMMYFADFGKFSYSGPAIGVCLLFTLATCLTLAPAMLYAAGGIVFWPFKQPAPAAIPMAAANPRSISSHGAGHIWTWISRQIVRRPGLILIVAVALMIYPATQGIEVPLTYNLLNELQDDRSSVVGTDMLRRHFLPGETGPLTIVAFQENGRFDTKQGERKIAELTKVLHDTDGVANVRSYAEPLGDEPGLFNPLSARGRRKMAAKRHPMTKATYLTQVPQFQGEITRFDVVMKYDPFSPEATAVLNSIDERLAAVKSQPGSPWQGAEFDFVGTTAGKRDLQAVTESDQQVIMRLVVVAVLAVILVILRRPAICLYLILSVVASYLVTIGLTELFFGWLYAGTFEGLDWKVPIFLFVILVAVGQDYNIYLITRVLEEQERSGPIEGLRRAVMQTGTIITSCGIIMAGSFCSMMSGTLRGMQELGFALTLGIVLDTFFVRTVLVPSALALAYRWRRDDRPPLPLEAEDETISHRLPRPPHREPAERVGRT